MSRYFETAALNRPSDSPDAAVAAVTSSLEVLDPALFACFKPGASLSARQVGEILAGGPRGRPLAD